MTNHSVSTGKESGGEAERIRTDLEARLSAQPTLDTDIMEFLAIAGMSYRDWQPFRNVFKYDQPFRHIREDLEQKRRDRTRSLSQGDRLVEGYIAKAITYEYLSGNIKTVGDFKREVEQSGCRIPYLSFRGIAKVNALFKRFGMEPMTVPYGGAKELAKYRLTKRAPQSEALESR